MRTNEIKNEINEIKKWEEKIKLEDRNIKQKVTHMIFRNIKQ